MKIDSNRLESCIDVDRWTARECREYLRYAGREYASAVSAPPALVARVRERLAALQLTELWPVDPRD